MYCIHCGAQLPSGAAFCRACGKPVVEAPEVDAGDGAIQQQAPFEEQLGSSGQDMEARAGRRNLIEVLGEYLLRGWQNKTRDSRSELLGILGSIAIFVGVFTPMMSFPMFGTISFLGSTRWDGIALLVIAVLAFILAVQRRYRWLLWPGFLAVSILVYTFMNMQGLLSEARASLDQSLADNPFGGLVHLAVDAIQWQWGWAVLIAGIVLLAIAAVSSKTEKYLPASLLSRDIEESGPSGGWLPTSRWLISMAALALVIGLSLIVLAMLMLQATSSSNPFSGTWINPFTVPTPESLPTFPSFTGTLATAEAQANGTMTAVISEARPENTATPQAVTHVPPTSIPTPPTLAPTPQPTAIAQQETPTTSPLSSPSVNNTANSAQAIQSGGLGLTRAAWDKLHGPPDQNSAYLDSYENGLLAITVESGLVTQVEVHYASEESGVMQPMSVARAKVQTLLPHDAVLVSGGQNYRPFNVYIIIVDRYFSPSLSSQYGKGAAIWKGADPGTFVVEYEGSDRVFGAVLAVGGSGPNVNSFGENANGPEPPAITPGPASVAHKIKSGGLGVTRARWEAVHGPGTVASSGYSYSDGYELTFTTDSIVLGLSGSWGDTTGKPLTLANAKQKSKDLIPEDSVLLGEDKWTNPEDCQGRVSFDPLGR